MAMHVGSPEHLAELLKLALACEGNERNWREEARLALAEFHKEKERRALGPAATLGENQGKSGHERHHPQVVSSPAERDRIYGKPRHPIGPEDAHEDWNHDGFLDFRDDASRAKLTGDTSIPEDEKLEMARGPLGQPPATT